MSEDNAVVQIAKQLGDAMNQLSWTTPSHVYNPLDYAWDGHRQYLQRFGQQTGRTLMLGMNPGPWGMAQTGVPFGDITMVRDWFHINGKLGDKLPETHPKYPILGMNCHRGEGSGSRVWRWAEDRFGAPEAFFDKIFVWNYCPLLFIKDNRNLVPEKLRKAEREPLFAACNQAFGEVVEALQPARIIGIGRFAEKRAGEIVGDKVPVEYLLHPSPANPMANKCWTQKADEALL